MRHYIRISVHHIIAFELLFWQFLKKKNCLSRTDFFKVQKCYDLTKCWENHIYNFPIHLFQFLIYSYNSVCLPNTFTQLHMGGWTLPLWIKLIEAQAIEDKGPCTNHVDRFFDFFNPPPPSWTVLLNKLY